MFLSSIGRSIADQSFWRILLAWYTTTAPFVRSTLFAVPLQLRLGRRRKKANFPWGNAGADAVGEEEEEDRDPRRPNMSNMPGGEAGERGSRQDRASLCRWAWRPRPFAQTPENRGG